MIHEFGSTDDLAWDRFVASHPAGHILQSSRWAQLKRTFGWESARTVVGVGGSPADAIRGGSVLLFRRLPWGQTLAYAPKGPVVDWGDTQACAAVLEAARQLCASHHAAFLKIEPELAASPSAFATLRGLGLRESVQRVQPVSTVHLDLTRDDEGILAAMKAKWRYNIRLAERKGVTVRPGSSGDLPAIQRLMAATARRDGFAVHELSYHAAATELFATDGSLVWLMAEHDGELLAAIAAFAQGNMAWYMWGASGDEGRHLMPNHALQWAAIRWARARGCQVYDLWGIPDEIGLDPDAFREPDTWGAGGLWGVYRFKQGFGGRVVRYVGAWDLPISSTGYACYLLALRLRRLLSRQSPVVPAA